MHKSQVEPLKRIYTCVKKRSPLPYNLQSEGWRIKIDKKVWLAEVSSLDSWAPRSILKPENYRVYDPAGNDLTAEMYIVAEDIEMALKFIDPKYHDAIRSTQHLTELKRKQLETMSELQLALVKKSKEEVKS
jgi:hypothetical protein